MKTTKNMPISDNHIELTIDSMSSEGQGVARHDGLVYFVEGAVTGETVIAKVIKRKKSFVTCTTHKLLSPTPHLNSNYNEQCDIQGGCSILKLNYEQQLAEKQNTVKQAFRKIAFLTNNDKILDNIKVHASPQVNRYRNKAIYPAATNKNNQVDFGYYQKGSHTVVFSHDSILEHENNAAILHAVKQFVNKKGLSAYNTQQHRGLIRSVLCRTNARDEHLVCLIINSKNISWAQEFADFLQNAIPQVTHVGFVYNTQRTPVQLTGQVKMLTPEPFYDYLGALRFEIAADAFFQVNRAQTQRIYQRIVELAALQNDDTVWDIYCGVGSISAFLAQKAGKVQGNEVVSSAVKNAERNMQVNNINNVEFTLGVAEKIIPQWLKTQRPSVVVLDPPRKGADTEVLDAITKAQPKRIVYMSCKPSTLARDVAYLHQHGYELATLEAYDFFPHTMHVECVALLTKKD